MKRRRERFRTEAVRREREASIAKSNPKHLARDNQHLISGGKACHSIEICGEGCRHLVGVTLVNVASRDIFPRKLK